MSKKKLIIIISIVVAVALAIAGTTILLINLFSDGSAKANSGKSNGPALITVGSVEGSKGDIVKVPVEISNNPGIGAEMFTFTYDSTAVKYIGYEKGDVLSDYEFSDNNGTLKFLGLEDGDVDKNGTMFTLKFEILDKKGSDIEITVNDIINYDEQSIENTAKGGKIKVK